MISRRPNTLASTEKRPGPAPIIARRMVNAKICAGNESNTIGVETGRTDREIPTTSNATIIPASGVKNPASNMHPAMSADRPITHDAGVASDAPTKVTPWTTIAIPITARSSSNDIPGRPPGNAEKRSRSHASYRSFRGASITPNPG